MTPLSPRRSLRVACLQVSAGSDWQKNLAKIERNVCGLLLRGTDLIALPEMFYWRGAPRQMESLARDASPKVLERFRKLAQKNKTAFLLGSLLEKSPRAKKFFNTSYLISEKGSIAASYRKVHLFDVCLGRQKIRESEHICAGKKIVTGQIFGRLCCGLTICYDLRFPELFRSLTAKGARLVFAPANFTAYTGKAHWETLLRARAIENQVFIVAPAQTGVHPVTKVPSFGTSLIIDPWGRNLGRASRYREQSIAAELNFDEQDRIRKLFPCLQHRRIF